MHGATIRFVIITFLPFVASLPRLGGFVNYLNVVLTTSMTFLSCLVGKQSSDACTDHNESATLPSAGRSRALACGWLLACWNCGLDSRRLHGCLSVLSAVCCTGTGPCDGPITRPGRFYHFVCVCVCGGGFLSVIKYNNIPLHLQQVGRKRSE